MTDTKHIRKAATAIYITCDKEVADDISAMLSEAADTIDALKAEVARLTECEEAASRINAGLMQEVARLRGAIANEPELPGGMPDEMWDAIKGDRDATEEGMRIVVRRTKQGILDAAAPEDE